MTTVAVARHAMATRFEIVLHGEYEVGLRAAAEEALDEIERLEAQLNLYQPTSEISHINARAAFEPVRVEPSLFRLLQHAQRLSQETAGAFDITVAPLMRCWGFMRGTGRLPHPAELAEARERGVMGRVGLDEADSTVRCKSCAAGAVEYGHVIDQREGEPLDGAVLAAVALPSATESDALSTALLILGSAGHERVAGLRAGMRTLVVSRGEQDGQLSVKAKGIQLVEPVAPG